MSVKERVFSVMTSPEGRTFEEMKTLCLGAEKFGYDLFVITDHFMNMLNPDGPRNHPLECWTTLAGLAAVTSKIQLGPLVSCYYYRRPTVLAKMATTVDIISNGRLVFGVGAGWHQKEFMGFMGQFPPVKERMQGLEETIQICKSMFVNERTSFNGELYQVDQVLNSPLPLQRPPPIMVGGGGEKKTLRIAAKYADISHFAFSPSIELLERKLQALKSHCKVVGRDSQEVQKGISVFPILGLTENEVEHNVQKRAQRAGIPVKNYRRRMGPVIGIPTQCISAMEMYIENGVDFFTLGFTDLKDMELFAVEVLPKLR